MGHEADGDESAEPRHRGKGGKIADGVPGEQLEPAHVKTGQAADFTHVESMAAREYFCLNAGLLGTQGSPALQNGNSGDEQPVADKPRKDEGSNGKAVDGERGQRLESRSAENRGCGQ